MVHSLDSDNTLRALMRFIAHSGQPEVIFSDHGTKFVTASRIMTKRNRAEVQYPTGQPQRNEGKDDSLIQRDSYVFVQ